MADLDRELRDAASHVAPHWDDARARRVREAMHARKARRAQVRRVGSAAALAVVVLLTLAGSGRLAAAASALVRFFSTLATSEPVAPPATPAVVASATAVAAHEHSSTTSPAEDTAAAAPEASVVPPSTIAPKESAPTEKPRPSPASDKRDWRTLARDQNFAAAYDAFHKGPKDVRDEAEDLLLASDVARLSKHPDEAVEPLRTILREHRNDSRAPLAAFTLGRVLLSDLHRAGEAADAFADARSLAPNGALAEDALAREVEAAATAGDSARAHARAEEYLAKYPNGTRTATVRRFGALP